MNTLAVHAPYDGSLLETLATDDAVQVEEALADAVGFHRRYPAGLPVHERVAILEGAALAMDSDREQLAAQIAREGGKPLVDARVEVERAVDGMKLAAETIRTEAGQVVPVQATAAGAGRLACTQREPVGVVVAVSAFNHPLNLVVHQVAAAVAAGCPVLVKPAEDTPLSCRSLVGYLHQAGLPAAACRMLLPVSLRLAERLVIDPRVGFFSFIGSARVGWMLRAKLAPGTRCALEHGGAAPVLVAADADLAAAAASLAKGAFYHAGQVCVSVQRIFVQRSVAADFAAALAARAEALVVGDPLDATTEVGPLIRAGEVERVGDWVDEAVAVGARPACGAVPLDHQCYAPTVLLDPPDDARVSREEIFGPVACIYPVSDLEEAIARANALPLAFQAAVFTRDLDTALRAYRGLAASAVMVNDHSAFRVDNMPFAGLRQSGLGIGGIPHTIADMQSEKMLVLRQPIAPEVQS